HAGHHRLELAGEHLLAQGADRQRGDRDAQLHRGDEPRRIARDPQHRAGPTVALPLELADARTPRRDEAVLGRHEEGIQEDQARQSQELEKKGHPSVARRPDRTPSTGRRTYVLSWTVCGPSTARSPARSRSTASRGWRSPGRSTRTWGASTAAPSATSVPSSCGPTVPSTRATARRSASR